MAKALASLRDEDTEYLKSMIWYLVLDTLLLVLNMFQYQFSVNIVDTAIDIGIILKATFLSKLLCYKNITNVSKKTTGHKTSLIRIVA